MKSDKIEQMNKNEEMSGFQVAKKNYYEFKKIADDCFEGLKNDITDYVSELEQKNEELVELLKRATVTMIKNNMKGFSIVRDIKKYLKGQ